MAMATRRLFKRVRGGSMKIDENYAYRCKFCVEILVNREQEYIRKRKSKYIGFEEYSSEFEDGDTQNAKRWITDTTTSFYAKTLEEVINKINFQFHNGRIDSTPLVEDDYFYWFDNNCFVDNQRLLHRATLTIDYACSVVIEKADLEEMAHVKVKALRGEV